MASEKFLKNLYHQFKLPKRDIDLIICHVLKINTAALFIFDKLLSTKQQKSIVELLQKRENGKPFAYIIGSKDFWNLNFKVNQHTLIPRPETELIVELMLQWTDVDFNGNILDLGTGTGAIGLSIAKERPLSRITAIDYSIECVKISKFNQTKHMIENVEIFQSDWFSKVKQSKFDYIVSNPPYITENDSHLDGLSFEPISALTAKDNGYADLKLIINQAKNYLKNSGKILLEHGYNQHSIVQELLNNNNYTDIVTHNDNASIPRITSATFKN